MKRKLFDLGTATPREIASATRALGSLERFSEFCAAHDAAKVAASVQPSEEAQAIAHIATIDAWLDRFILDFPQRSRRKPAGSAAVDTSTQQ
jgi:hypothetical protein